MTEEKQPGQSIILVAIMLLAIVALAALAVDMTNVYFVRRTAQNAADAAALAGGEELARQKNEYGGQVDNKGDEELIVAAVNELAERNGTEDTDPVDPLVNANVEAFYLDGNDVRLEPAIPLPVGKKGPPIGALGIEAVTHITAPSFLGGVLGWDGYPVSALAAVSIRAPVCGVTCVVPIATYWYTDIREFELSSDPDTWEIWSAENPPPFECYNIWNGSGPGNFGWLNWRLQGSPCGVTDCDSVCLAENLDPDNCVGYIGIGEDVAGAVGVMNDSKVIAELKKYVGIPGDPDNPPQSFKVPLYAVASGTGCNVTYVVAGFAEMQLVGFDLSQGAGATYDPWFAGEWPEYLDMCHHIEAPGADPNSGNRLTAYFKGIVDPSSIAGECEGYGTITTIRIRR